MKHGRMKMKSFEKTKKVETDLQMYDSVKAMTYYVPDGKHWTDGQFLVIVKDHPRTN